MSLVGAFAASHAPGITGRPSLPPPAQSAPVLHGYAALRARLEAARPDVLLHYPRERLEAEAGPGGHEIRTWIAVAGTAGDARGSLLAYQPVPAWSTGCAVAALKPR